PITGNLLSLARPELQLELRAALFQALERNQAAVSRPVIVAFNGERRRVVISVRPRMDDSGLQKNSERQALVFFLEDEAGDLAGEAGEGAMPHNQAENNRMVAQLQAEIQRLREQLQLTLE